MDLPRVRVRSEIGTRKRFNAEFSHDLILSQTAVGIRVHGVAAAAAARCEILDEAQTQWPAAILVSLELGDRGFSCTNTVESDNSSSAGAATGLVLDLGLLNLANCCEQLHQVLVTSRPRKLGWSVTRLGVMVI